MSRIDLTTQKVVSLSKAARHFDVSLNTMWRWALSGKIPSVKIGGSRKTTIEAVAASAVICGVDSDVDSECGAAGI